MNIYQKIDVVFKNFIKRYNLNDNKILTCILEDILCSDFVLTNQEKVIYASTKYKQMINNSIVTSLKEYTIHKCTSRTFGSVEIINKKRINGPIYMFSFELHNRQKGCLIIKYNDKVFDAKCLMYIDSLINYIFLI